MAWVGSTVPGTEIAVGMVPVMATVESMEDAGMITAGAGLTEVVAGTTELDRTR